MASEGLTRRAAREGLEEAAEEAGVSLATQAYQNSTGRRHGLDVTDLATNAIGGLAGGAAAPLAGLGRHATGRVARMAEHVGREMTGEMIADQAASLATGQGLTSLEDAARAAASGARGSATAQTDHALQARLNGQLSALSGPSLPPLTLPGPASPELPLGSAAPGTSACGGLDGRGSGSYPAEPGRVAVRRSVRCLSAARRALVGSGRRCRPDPIRRAVPGCGSVKSRQPRQDGTPDRPTESAQRPETHQPIREARSLRHHAQPRSPAHLLP